MNDKYVEQHLKMKYFVLKPKGDNIYAKASRRAIRAYASVIQEESPKFAEELDKWVADEALEVITNPPSETSENE